MTYLVDTDWAAAYLKGKPVAVVCLDGLAPAGPAMSLVTYGELWEGLEGSTDPRMHLRIFRQFLQWVDVLPLKRHIMRRFARERRALRQSGQIIADLDLLIAATALHHGLPLVTRNHAHFRRIPGLELAAPPPNQGSVP